MLVYIENNDYIIKKGGGEMSIIYEPKGKAREYSPLAVNIYTGCDHKCLYCYAPNIRRKTLKEYSENIQPRNNIINQLKNDCRKYQGSKQQVLFNFMHDPYSHINEKYGLTRQALKLMLNYRIPVAILTKGGLRAQKDFDIMEKFGESIKIGTTFTFENKQKSLEWERDAAIPSERIEMLKNAKERGIKTWASFEPVIEPEESLKIMEISLPYVDEYKIGKINNYKGLDKNINWTKFLKNVVFLLRKNKKPFYIKYDLRQNAPTIKLFGNEILPDEFCVKPFDSNELF